MTNLQSADPVVELGLQIAELEARYDELVDLEFAANASGDLSAEGYYETAKLDVHCRIDALKDALSCYEAHTLEGAMIHIARAYCLVDALYDAIENPNYHTKEDRRFIDRMLVSALRLIERLAEGDLNSLGLSSLRNSHLDPWVRVEDRLLKIKAETTAHERAEKAKAA